MLYLNVRTGVNFYPPEQLESQKYNNIPWTVSLPGDTLFSIGIVGLQQMLFPVADIHMYVCTQTYFERSN